MILVRFRQSQTETIGILAAGGHLFYILEPLWRGNQRNVSCIPPGKYRCVFMSRSASGKYKNCYHVQDVPDRTGVLIHAGNVADHTRGCLLPGLKLGKLDNKNAVLSSRKALDKIVQLMGDEFELEIIDGV